MFTDSALSYQLAKSVTDWSNSGFKPLSLCISGILEPLVPVWFATIFPGWWINRDSCVRSIQTSCSRLGVGLKSGFENASINSAITAGTAAPWTETILFLGESYSAVSTRNVSVSWRQKELMVLSLIKKKTNKNAKSLTQRMTEVIMLNVAAMDKLSNIY